MVKNPPAKQEMWVPSLGGRDPQEKDMAAHSSILAWEIPWTEEPGSPWGHKRVGHNLADGEKERTKGRRLGGRQQVSGRCLTSCPQGSTRATCR